MRGEHLLQLRALGVTDGVARALGALEVALEGALDRLEERIALFRVDDFDQAPALAEIKAKSLSRGGFPP